MQTALSIFALVLGDQMSDPFPCDQGDHTFPTLLFVKFNSNTALFKLEAIDLPLSLLLV